MSKKVQYPDGYVGVVSDKVAEILGKRKGHKIIGEAAKTEKSKSDDKTGAGA